MNMGMGKMGGSNVVVKRKFRWTFEITNICTGGSIPKSFVKLASRPNLTIEETEINFLNAKTWIPGKGTWETITVTYYDVGGFGDALTGGTTDSPGSNMAYLWQWLTTVYDFSNPVTLFQASRRGAIGQAGYAATGNLELYDGCGTVMEQWRLGDVWPQAINFGELDYSSSEECTIELTLRYSNVQFTPGCGIQKLRPCCAGC